jgi:head-tail adaptor
MPDIPNIRLKSRVQLINTVQTVQGQSILVTLVPIATVYGDLTPSRPHLSIGENQLDIDTSQKTHRLIIRWQDSIDIFDTVIRDTFKPDDTIRRETFRVLGTNDMDNSRRFLYVDLQLRTTEPYPYSFTIAETGNASDSCDASVS